MTQLQALVVALDVGVPTILWGDPGIGKTSTIYQLAEHLNLPVEVVIAALREPTDFGGLPMVSRTLPAVDRQLIVRYIAGRWGFTADEVELNFDFFVSTLGAPSVDNGTVRFAPPHWAQRLARLERGLLFLDEISTARPAVQTALLRVVLERVVGELPLNEGIRVVAAANKPDQIAGGWDLSSPLANRFCHLEWNVDAKSWCAGFLYGWSRPEVQRVPENWRESLPTAKQHVTAFITHRPEHLKHVPNDESQAGLAWASPRSWESACKLHAACLAGGFERDVDIALVRGCVGDGPAFEFFQYLDELDLPHPEELLANPLIRLPDRDDQLYAALGSVVHAVRQDLSADRWQRGWRVLDNAASQRSVDIAVAHAKALAEVRPNGAPVPKEAAKFVQLLRKAKVLG